MPNRKNLGKTEKGMFDYTLLFVVILLMAIGFIMIYSASYYSASVKFGSGAYYLKRQIAISAVGFVMMIGATIIPWNFIKKITPYFFIFMIFVQAFTMVAGVNVNGSRRWLGVGQFRIQPSEISKIALILFIALICSQTAKKLNITGGIIKILLMAAVMCATIVKEDLSTSVVMFGTAFVITFIASKKRLPFIGIIIAAVGIVAVFVKMFPYRSARIEGWLHVETSKNAYQIRQGLYAIGSGGWFGKGLGQSIQKFNLPEPHTDMIFSILCEELGIIGGIAVIVLFGVLIWRFVLIAFNAATKFESFTVIGVMAHIGLQAIVNIGVATNLLPNTGVTLPFISYGGTSIAFLLVEIGIVLNVSRRIRLNAAQADERVVAD